MYSSSNNFSEVVQQSTKKHNKLCETIPSHFVKKFVFTAIVFIINVFTLDFIFLPKNKKSEFLIFCRQKNARSSNRAFQLKLNL